MTGFTVALVKSQGLSDDECRRRLHAAYAILLDASRQKNTVKEDESSDELEINTEGGQDCEL